MSVTTPITMSPLTAAVARVALQTPVASVLRTNEWADMPLALRERSFWSAGIEDARYLSAGQTGVLNVLSLARERAASGETAFADRESAIRAIRSAAYAGGLGQGTGTLTDPASRVRAALIVDRNVQAARGFAAWTSGQDQDLLDAFPAQELVYNSIALHPRGLGFWQDRWEAAGGRLVDGRMVALKNDPIWVDISDFDVPWPPFAWGSRGTRLRDIGRSQAIELGLLAPDDTIAPIDKQFNAELEASADGLSDEVKQGLKSIFGPQISIDGDRVRWQAGADAYESQQNNLRPETSARYEGLRTGISGLRSGDSALLAETADSERQVREWSGQIAAAESGSKPLFHESIGEPAASNLAAIIRRDAPPGVTVHVQDGQVYVFRPNIIVPDLPTALRLGDSGRALGYGHDFLTEPKGQKVNIRESDGERVSSFYAPAERGRLFAAARAKDFADATGKSYGYRIGDAP